MQVSVLARAARVAVRICLRPALQPAFSINTQRVWANITTRMLSVPFGVRFAKSCLAGIPVEKVQPKAGHRSSARALLFLHGGGFVIGSPASHRSITGRLAKLARVTVYAPDYRLAPEHPFPAALDDAFACYRALLEEGYAAERIAVAGDSAGGGLALSLCLRLRYEEIARPGCIVLISPWADLTLSQLADVPDDALLRSSWLAHAAAAYLRGRPADSPLVSPLFADLAGLPPILVQSASEEILREDSRRLVQALAAARVPVSHREFPQMWHDFQLYAGMVPEATLALEEIARFVTDHLTVKTRDHAVNGIPGAFQAGAVQSSG
jgi:monoterpene epsilon-lactone hydrolase